MNHLDEMQKLLEAAKNLFEYKINGRPVGEFEVDGIDTRDYPDFVDAFISSATFLDTGEMVDDATLDQINDDSDLVYQAVQDHLY